MYHQVEFSFTGIDLYTHTSAGDADAAMLFLNNEAFTDNLNALRDNYEDPLPSGYGAQQWVIAYREVMWMKYPGPHWETWDVCEVGPENQCPYP